MSVYRRFERQDILYSVLNTSQRIELTSGSTGWQGAIGTSGSTSLYGGFRGRVLPTGITVRPTYRLNSYTIDGFVDITGSYPVTASVAFSKVRNSAQTTDRYNWGEEHFAPILRLYDYYSAQNPDYMTGSYDYYCLYFQSGSANRVRFSSNSAYLRMTSSFTIETTIKPFTLSGSGDMVLAEHGLSGSYTWRLYVRSLDGRVVFADDVAAFSSSIPLTLNRWSHVCVSVSNNTGSFTFNLQDAGTFTRTGSMAAGLTESIVLGNEFNGTLPFRGFMFETRLWSAARSASQVSSSYNRTLSATSSLGTLVLYNRANDGPLNSSHAFSIGSGSRDHSNVANNGQLLSFTDRSGPTWHPNDNVNFYTPKALANISGSSVSFFKVVSIPSAYYGRGIMTGSVRMTCQSFTAGKLRRTIVDDGRGGLYISGSASSSSLDDREDYAGVKWNKVGNVFYSEGLIVIRDPALLDFAEGQPNNSLNPSQLFQLNFRSFYKIPTKIFMCRLPAAEYNASNNPSFSRYDDTTGKNVLVRDESTTYVTAVGLYNKDRKLVAIAKLAQPIRKREKDSTTIRLKIDF